MYSLRLRNILITNRDSRGLVGPLYFMLGRSLDFLLNTSNAAFHQRFVFLNSQGFFAIHMLWNFKHDGATADQFPAGNLNSMDRCGGSIKEIRKEKKRKGHFEFCKVCRINHDDGRRHNYFASHTKSLSSLFSRFQKKVSDVRSSLKNPKFLVSEPSRDRIWCVFCEMDIHEQGNSFEWNNAIRHLASEEHLKGLKHFLWKYGGGMNKADSFIFTEAEFSKWENKCEVLQSEAASIAMKSDGSQHGLSTDIHTKRQIMKNLGNKNAHLINSNLSTGVLPLQYNTNENYQVSHSDISHVTYDGSSLLATSSSLPLAMKCNSPTSLAAHCDGQCFIPYHVEGCSPKNRTDNYWVIRNQNVPDECSSSQGFQSLTQVSARGAAEVKGNVHSGAPPPWFNSTEADEFDVKQHSKSGKSSKLNPKRVGAAWAEKRKIEMEMERRGEITANVGADWLPNFGRVWQSGSRKESKKQFEMEKQKSPDTGSHSEVLTKIQPYISKRMRRNTDEGSSDSRSDLHSNVI